MGFNFLQTFLSLSEIIYFIALKCSDGAITREISTPGREKRVPAVLVIVGI